MATTREILFEPWNLGDAVIAFATAVQDPHRIALACSSRWFTILRSAAGAHTLPHLIPVDLGYVTRQKHRHSLQALPPETCQNATVLSIRGDLRDYRSARKLFPYAPLRMTGWIPFLAHRFALPDLPFAHGWAPVRNRYASWASLAAVEWSRVEKWYRRNANNRGDHVLVHVGAQWASKQYPFAAELVKILRRETKVVLAAGPKDPLPEGINEIEVTRLADSHLVDALSASYLVIANDTGPMHLAAFMGCRTILVTRQAAMTEWLPPFVEWLHPQNSPQGYKASRSYFSDVIAGGWPSPDQILDRVLDTVAV